MAAGSGFPDSIVGTASPGLDGIENLTKWSTQFSIDSHSHYRLLRSGESC